MSKRERDEDDLEIAISNWSFFEMDELVNTLDGQFNLDDPDEFYELEKAVCCKDPNYINSCAKRYHRYLEGITDWIGFTCIEEDIRTFLKMYYSKNNIFNNRLLEKIELSKKIDKALYILAAEVRENGDILDEHQIKKMKSDLNY